MTSPVPSPTRVVGHRDSSASSGPDLAGLFNTFRKRPVNDVVASSVTLQVSFEETWAWRDGSEIRSGSDSGGSTWNSNASAAGPPGPIAGLTDWPAAALDIRLAGGHRLRVRAGCDRDLLAAALAALGGRPC
jgi:hypothetical protein